MPVLTLSAIYRYPVKSLRGESFKALDVAGRGFVHDREWMLVDMQGRFLTQRQQPRMSLIDASVTEDGAVRLQAPGMPVLRVETPEGGHLEVTVWGDQVTAMAAGHEADGWFSDFLGTRCRLAHFPPDRRRMVDPDYALPGDQVGFADGFPFLLISQGSLDALNGRLEQPVPMLRFRPNLVVSGCEPHAEDGWRRIRIGGVTFRVAKPCSRCIIPTIDPQTAERSPEPLRTLMTYRKRDNKVYFGQNLIHDDVGRLEVGTPVEVLE
jgi:uncharacterized protein YcbX